MYSSVWNWVISFTTAGLARCSKTPSVLRSQRGTIQVEEYGGDRNREPETDVNFEIFVDIVVHDQAVRQPNSVWLHRVTSDICIVANIRVVEIGNLLLACVQLGEQGPRPIDSSWVGRHTGTAGRTALCGPGIVGWCGIFGMASGKN